MVHVGNVVSAGAGRGGGGAWADDIIGYRNIFYGDYRYDIFDISPSPKGQYIFHVGPVGLDSFFPLINYIII